MQLTDKQLAVIITWAKKTPEVQAVFLYGSRAKGSAKPDSDVVLRTRQGLTCAAKQ